MKFSSHPLKLVEFDTDLLIIPVIESDLAPLKSKKAGNHPLLHQLDFELRGGLLAYIGTRSFKGKADESLLISGISLSVPNILLVGVDRTSQDSFTQHGSYRSLGALLAKKAKEVSARNVHVATTHLSIEQESKLTSFIEGVVLASYEYTAYKSKKSESTFIEQVTFLQSKKLDERVVSRALELSHATSFARDLINMPPNDCTPPHLVAVAKEVAQKGKLKIQVFDKAALEKMGAHSLLSVSKGTVLPPYLIKLTYQPTQKTSKTKVVSIVGKGITYDTGGYSLKPSDGMIGMKGDMAGAACVLGVMQAVSRLKPSVEVRGYIPTTENMVNGEATRVGDIVKAMNGKTIEILNTDAEGRLILADALTLACKDKANIVVDIATLTGACMVALGMQYAGIFSDDEKLSQEIITQGAVEGERYWSLPLAPEYAASIKSSVADLKNISGNRWAGATIGGLFLKEFVADTRWAHLDIAGPSDSDSAYGHITQGGVGFGVRTLTRMILNQR